MFEAVISRDTLIFGFSGKSDGSMKIQNDGIGNRNKYFTSKNLDCSYLVTPELANGCRVKIVNKNDKGKIIPGADGLITKSKNIILTITVADCFPVYFYDAKKGIVALAHAGWRGVYKGIIENTINVMCNKLPAKHSNIQVYIGPGLQKCHFKIRHDVRALFSDYNTCICTMKDKSYLDLKKVIFKKLRDSNINNDNIKYSEECTYCENNKYFSYRRDGILKTMIAYIGMLDTN